LTPPAVLAALGNWEFDLDPCAPIVRPWPTARQHYTVLDNGLIQRWFGRVWLNPPYLRHVIGRWLARMAEHNRGIALIFARTETAAFHRYVWAEASALLFPRGRLDFCTVDGKVGKRPDGTDANSGAPSVLCAYGPRDAEVLAFCGLDGQFVPLRFPRSVWSPARADLASGAHGLDAGAARPDRARRHLPRLRRPPEGGRQSQLPGEDPAGAPAGPVPPCRRGQWSAA
jgi:hypothetical protein